MPDFRDVMRRQIVQQIEARQPAPDPAAVFLAELRGAMIEIVTRAEASRTAAPGPDFAPLTIQAQSFDDSTQP